MDAEIASRTDETGSPPPTPSHSTRPKSTAYVLAVIVAAIVAATAWYLALPPPLLVQGVADSTRIDLAARVDGRVKRIAVRRGQDVAADAVAFDPP